MTRLKSILALMLLQLPCSSSAVLQVVPYRVGNVFVLLRSRAGAAIRLQLFGFHAHIAELRKS